MPLLHRRFKRLQSVLNRRMSNLTVVLEHVEKPHNLSAILRTCDAVGVLEVHTISPKEKVPTFNSTAQGSQKWVGINSHQSIKGACMKLKQKGFKLYGTNLDTHACDYRQCDFTGPTAFVLGTEKWGLSKTGTELVDESVLIPMRGMVQSLNVSVATATLLFEALRQRELKGIVPECGEGVSENLYKQIIFEWCYPEVADWCKKLDREYPLLSSEGVILEELPRTEKFRY